MPSPSDIPSSSSPTPHPLRAWGAAVRPPSLLLAIAPVLVGVSLGYRQTGQVDLVLALLALLAAVLMQVITNLQNDVGYTQRGAEHVGQRIGLPRATALGWLSPRQVRLAIVVLSALATGLGFYMVALRGWPVLALGSASLLAALAYMGGPRPIAYTPWGEATVFVFFGPVAVLGTGWLLTGGLSGIGVFASMAVGSMAAAALAVNNHRDMAHDRLAGRRTFAVVYGARASQRWFALLLFLPFALALVMALFAQQVWPLLVWTLAWRAWNIYRDFGAVTQGVAYNAILFRTFRLGWWFAVALSLSAWLLA
ncbi:1,4-dihydroxy-2-naphthoate octaprenyltransferase [Rhodoferax sp. GW822-FHT02A01]|uniref:1,4-dihydroxy-2-naphthoate octaprenyltransferase n=1 Tax=Rhodoferax sp. GW822-FHT02A01 TaxID=3141537 RepID=UPI00315C90B7